MSNKDYQSFSNQYYRLTGKTYRRLDPNGTDFMNLGLWPADSISNAQKKVYESLIGFCHQELKLSESEMSFVCELGCGWGGGIEVLSQEFSDAQILGVNSSEIQIEYCKLLYNNSDRVFFKHGFYEDLDLLEKRHPSLVLGVESLLHCGNRESVFEMIHRNQFDYVGLAEIVLADQDARNHRLFNPALSYAANFNEYQELFNKFGFELVLERDMTLEVFEPWAHALKALTPEMSGIHKKIKAQFIESYSVLSELGKERRAKYIFLVAKKRAQND